MQSAILAASIALGLSTSALAQPAPQQPARPPRPIVLPKAYVGYNQPEITTCKPVTTARSECTVPAMTAGRYAIIVAGAAVSTGAGAKQGLALIVGGRPCIRTQPAPFQGSGSIRVACEVNLLTDEPITIAALYNTVAATPGPKGLTVVVRRLPWTGVLEAQGAVVRPSPQKSAPAAPGDKPAKAPRK